MAAPVLYNPVASGKHFRFPCNTRSNVVDRLQFKTRLAGQRGGVTVTDTNPDCPPRFYRVVVP